jgi:uncharacterized protein
MTQRLTIASLVLTGALLFAAPVFAYSSPGAPTGYVNDFAHVLSADTVQQLDATLAHFEASTSNQIAVVTVPNMGGDYVENYAVKLFEEWGIGQRDRDNGVLLLLAVEEHKIRIEVGYGLEGALPDSVAQRIINNDLTPNLKENKFDEGVTLATADIMRATQGEYTAPEKKKFPLSGNAIEALLVALFFGLQWIAAVLARSKSWWAGGVVGGFLGGGAWLWFGMALAWGLVTLGSLVVFGLLLDYLVSKTYTNKKTTGAVLPWWIGGGGGGGRGGGFGGFGGGSSGGGGASGSW